MKRARAKLRSRRGASITFALLIFLVCAVVSSVVVVAGSAAGGRMSQLAASDQRYYAVTSAAGLLRDVFDGQTVRVATNKADGTMSTGTDDDGILADASRELLRLQATSGESAEASSTRNFSLTVGAEKGLTCAIQETISRNGLATFQITSGESLNAAGAYTVQVVFSSDVRTLAADASAAATTTSVTWKLNGIRRGGGAAA